MRKTGLTIGEIKRRIENLKGQTVDMRVDYGRKRIETKSGIVENIYPALFTVKTQGDSIISFSYSDILCGGLSVDKRI